MTLEQQNKGPVMSRGRATSCLWHHMILHDVIGMIEGVGWVWEVEVGMNNTQAYQFFANFLKECVSKYSM